MSIPIASQEHPSTRYNSNSAALFFIHIAKTAGTSFTRIVETLYPPEMRCKAYYNQDLMEIDRGTLAQCRLFIGHIDYSAQELMPKPLNIVTFLRNPVERVISAYQHIKTRSDHPQHELLKSEVASLCEFAQHPVFSRQVRNPQTGVLGRDNNLKLLYELAETGEIEAREAKFLSTIHRDREVTKVDLLLAQKRLREIAFFGITEWFDASVAVFCDLFGLPLPEQAPKDNLSVYRQSGIAPRYTEQDLAAVKELCRIDEMLYAYAKQLFLTRFEAQLGRFRGRTAAREQGNLYRAHVV